MAALADAMLRNHVVLQRLSASELTKVDDFINQIADELARRLAGQDLTELGRARLERALERLNGYLSETLSQYRGEIMSDLLKIANREAGASVKTLNTTVEADFSAPTPLQVKTAALESPLMVSGPDGGKLLGTFLKGWTATEQARVTGAIRLGVAMGQTNAQIVKAVRGTAALNYADGALAITKRNADKIVHTAVQHVANAAREAVFAANEDIVDGVQWLATLDLATCPQCGALDGLEFDADSGPRPPLHILCRCATVPVLKGGLAKLSQGRTRPAVGDDGAEEVSGSTNYFQWLKTQPASFQDFALGPTRGKLLRDGGLSASRFAQLQLSKNFMPLTIADAEALDPIAFAKAGLNE